MPMIVQRLIALRRLKLLNYGSRTITDDYYAFDATVKTRMQMVGDSVPEVSLKLLAGKQQEMEAEIRIGAATYTEQTVAIIVISDVSQLKENISLREMNEAKTMLLGSVAHEIRSPLGASISLLTCAMEDPTVSTATKTGYLNLAINSSKLLLHIVNDFLDFAQLDFNKIRIVQVEINLVDKLNEIISLLNFQARAKGLQLILSYADDLPNWVKVDANRLSQIVINLLNNALKFTEEGSITLTVSRIPGTDRLRFEVRDTGLGISLENQRNL